MAAFDTKNLGNVKKKAHYRKINLNFKSPKKRKEEKLRRDKVRALKAQGMKNKDIALFLDCSVSTVKRDYVKVRRYVEGCANRQFMDQDQAFLEKFGGSSADEQMKIFSRMGEGVDVSRGVCSDLAVIIDVDAVLAGDYSLSFEPSLPLHLKQNAKITLELRVGGVRQKVGRL